MIGTREQACERVERVATPNVSYRDGIGERWIVGDGDRLESWGYLGPAEN